MKNKLFWLLGGGVCCILLAMICEPTLPVRPAARTGNMALAADSQPALPTSTGVAIPGPASPATQPSLSAGRTPHAPPKPGEVRDMEIKQLGNFDYDPDAGGTIPDDVRHLSGMTVRLKGFMVPMDEPDHMSRFALVPSLFGCWFGQPPSVQHAVIIKCAAGKTVPYITDPLTVEGVLTVGEIKEEGYIISLFQLASTSVKAMPAQ